MSGGDSIKESVISKCKLQIGNNIIKQEESFKYLGSIIAADRKCDVEIKEENRNRIEHV